jgi:hypothetical protein
MQQVLQCGVFDFEEARLQINQLYLLPLRLLLLLRDTSQHVCRCRPATSPQPLTAAQ